MTFVKQIGGAAAIGAAMLFGSGLSAPPVQAAYIATLEQVGSNVVATGTGTIDLTGLSFNQSVDEPASMSPVVGYIVTGPAPMTATLSDLYTGFAGPTSFGSKGATFASSGSGDVVGIDPPDNFLVVPHGYVSGALSDTSTYDNQTLSSLGVTPGTYVWTWGSGASDDSFTLEIGAAPAPVPEPASLSLLGAGLIGLILHFVFFARRRLSNAVA
jgi:hypothetical protein